MCAGRGSRAQDWRHAQPVAEFAAPLRMGRSPLTVDFHDFSTGVPATWPWDFGDGNTSTEQNPSHTFTSPGEYNIALQVSDAAGNDNSVELEAYVAVQ